MSIAIGRMSLLPVLLLITLGAASETLRLPDGSRYEGELRDGELNGQGVLSWGNGDRYEGRFRDGLMHGRGVLTSGPGDRYEGEFALGQFHGNGALAYADGSHYQGQFEQGYPSGTGTMRWPDGSIYTGELRFGVPWGKGRLVRSDGQSYEGGFQQGHEHGEGALILPDGSSYSGRFEQGTLVHGRWEDASGQRYEGGFANWQFSGEGSYTTAEGDRYTGVFADGLLDGEGIHEAPDGSRYEGELSWSMYHGRGRLMRADGSVQEGIFEYGEFQGRAPSFADTLLTGAADLIGSVLGTRDPPPVAPEALLAEQALYLQADLLHEALESVAPERPDRIDLYAIQVAGDGSQEVFRREVEYAREVLESQLGAAGRVVTLVNSRTSVRRWPMATRESLSRTLDAVAGKMNPEQDILFLYLTSHGSKDHRFLLQQNGIRLPNLSAIELATMLSELPLKHKVVVVSACYSGGFIPYLRDDRTLVMTAARADRTSFGCADENDFTDFGRALLEDGLGTAGSFVDAFEKAQARVREQELAQGIEQPSEPQIHREASVEAQLRAWRQQPESPR